MYIVRASPYYNAAKRQVQAAYYQLAPPTGCCSDDVIEALNDRDVTVALNERSSVKCRRVVRFVEWMRVFVVLELQLGLVGL